MCSVVNDSPDSIQISSPTKYFSGLRNELIPPQLTFLFCLVWVEKLRIIRRLSVKYSPHTEDGGLKGNFKLKIELASCYIITGSQLLISKS